MSAVIAEVRKVFAGQLWWAFLLVGVGLSVITIVAITPDHVAAVASGAGTVRAALDDATRYWMTVYLACGSLIAYLFAGEFTDGQMQRSVLLHRLSRGRVLGTKFVAALLVSVVFGLVAAALAWLTPPLALSLFGLDTAGAGVDPEIVAGVLGVNILASVWGFALGVLLRNPVVAVGLFAVQTLLLETYGAKAVPEVGKYLLTSVLGSLYKDPSALSMAVLPALSIALAWVGVAMVGAVGTFRTRDV